MATPAARYLTLAIAANVAVGLPSVVLASDKPPAPDKDQCVILAAPPSIMNSVPTEPNMFALTMIGSVPFNPNDITAANEAVRKAIRKRNGIEPRLEDEIKRDESMIRAIPNLPGFPNDHKVAAIASIEAGRAKAEKDLAGYKGETDLAIVAVCLDGMLAAHNAGTDYTPIRLGGARRGADGQFVVTPNP